MADEDTSALPIEIVRGTASAEEIAAIVAVVSEQYLEERADAVAEETSRSAWSVSQRALREPLRRDLGWRHTPC